jgi:hypothetical protein
LARRCDRPVAHRGSRQRRAGGLRRAAVHPTRARDRTRSRSQDSTTRRPRSPSDPLTRAGSYYSSRMRWLRTVTSRHHPLDDDDPAALHARAATSPAPGRTHRRTRCLSDRSARAATSASARRGTAIVVVQRQEELDVVHARGARQALAGRRPCCQWPRAHRYAVTATISGPCKKFHDRPRRAARAEQVGGIRQQRRALVPEGR